MSTGEDGLKSESGFSGQARVRLVPVHDQRLSNQTIGAPAEDVARLKSAHVQNSRRNAAAFLP
ncbi:hypothetical protein Q667_18560 [Marinobacter sp. C1S70]|nr:hypothetical protein Q667_18560 [Marinobacter sp. C1S70]